MVLDETRVASALLRAPRDEFDELGEAWRSLGVEADLECLGSAGMRP